jgi:hypothetical protein
MTEDTNGEVGVRPATSSAEPNTVEAIYGAKHRVPGSGLKCIYPLFAFGLLPCAFLLGRLNLTALEDFTPRADDHLFHGDLNAGQLHAFFYDHRKGRTAWDFHDHRGEAFNAG